MSNPNSTDFIETYSEALDADLCNQIIQRFEASENLRRGKTGAGVDLAKKDSYDLTITDLPDWKDVHGSLQDALLRQLIQYVRNYGSMLTGAVLIAMPTGPDNQVATLSPDQVQSLDETQIGRLLLNVYRPGRINIQKYIQGEGGYHHWHSEIYPQGSACEPLHRVLFFIFYLNDVAEGGETEFLYYDRNVSPERGKMVIAPAGFTHTHKGHTPRSNDKYVITSWVMFQRAEQLYGKPT